MKIFSALFADDTAKAYVEKTYNDFIRQTVTHIETNQRCLLPCIFTCLLHYYVNYLHVDKV